MDAIVDIAQHFKVFIPTETELHEFDMPPEIIFNRGDEQNVEVKLENEEEGDFHLVVNNKNFSGFSPHDKLTEAFKSVFDYYFYNTVTKKVAGESLEGIRVIIPLSFSISFENFIYKAIEDKCELDVYRDIEVYSAYYLEESRDLPELKRFAEDDEGAHVYGIVSSGDGCSLVAFNYIPGQTPEIIDFLQAKLNDLLNTFKLLIKKHSSGKSRVFFFTGGETEIVSYIFKGDSHTKEVQVEIEKDRKMPVRMLRKKNDDDNPIIKGIDVLTGKPEMTPLYRFFLFSQKTRTHFTQISIDKELNISVDFPKNPPREFFINFFVGTNRDNPNSANLILLERIFVDLGAIVDKHLEFKGKFERLENELKVNLLYQDKINRQAVLRLRKEYGVRE